MGNRHSHGSERRATLPAEFGGGSHFTATPWTGQHKLAAALLAELRARFILKIAASTAHGLSLLHSVQVGKEKVCIFYPLVQSHIHLRRGPVAWRKKSLQLPCFLIVPPLTIDIGL